MSAFPAHAETTVADFLKWERKAQDSFIQISLGMLGTVATQVKPEITRCIDEWYFANTELQIQRNSEVLEVMEQYTEFDPTAFILGYVESKCGKLK